jgi:hypothetical protein
VEEMKKSSVALVLTACLLGLAGCSGNQKISATDTVKHNFNATSTNNQNGVILNNTNQKLRISTRASNSVERMKVVDQALVIIRNNNAYVAVRLKNNGNGAGTSTTEIGGNGNNTNNTGMYGNGYNSGATGNNGLDGNINNPSTSGIGGTGTNAGTSGTSGVGTTGIGNGTTGLEGNRYSEVTTSLEQKIADRVRATDKNIHKVYVSFNPDFYNQMSTYSNNISNGLNRNSLLNDFSNTVRRFFR